MRDDELVPVFIKALIQTGQPHVARMLGYEDLDKLGVLLICFN